MLSYEDALDLLLAAVQPLEAVSLRLGDACGHVLAKDVAAILTQPPFAGSAMDGYAVRFADFPGPWHVIGESAAGKRYGGAVGAGEAVRIYTGAPLAGGADTVIIQEDVTREGDTLRLTGDGPSVPGAHIRPAGNDFTAGERLIAAGTRLTPAHIGLAAAAGHAALVVWRKPRVVLLATGNELVPPGTAPAGDQIVSSNGVMLAALLREYGADIRDLGIVADDLPAITAAIADAADADLIITIGGASVGDHDLVQAALLAAGTGIDFWKVAIRPGRPLIAGQLGNTRVLGLPGNPVSAYVCAVLFALPMLRRMGGGTATPDMIEAPLLAGLPANGNRRDHLRAVLGPDGVKPLVPQDSAMLGVLAAANALVIRSAGAPAASAGTPVQVLRLDRIFSAP